MGAGISAGAFADGFYKGYSLIEKSMADKEERELKRIKQEQDLKDNNTKLEREIGATLVSTTEKINAYAKDEAAATEKGDIESANAARASTEKLVNVTNQTITNVNKVSGKNFDIINLNPNTTTPLSVFTSPEGKEYVVPSLLVEQLDSLKGTEDGQKFFKVLPDGSLGIHTMDDATKQPTGNIDNKFIFKPLTRKDDKISFEEKGYNQWAAKPENKGKGIDEYKVYLKTSESMASESTKTTSKQYVDKNGNLVRLTDWEISNRTDKNELTEYKPEGESNSDKNLRFWEKANKKLKDTNPALYEQKKEEYMLKQTEANIAGVNYVGEQIKQTDLDNNTNAIKKAVTGETKNTQTDISTMESKQLNLYKKQDPDKYNELSAAKKEINQKKILVLELDSITKDTQKYIGKKALKTGLYDNIDQKVRALVGLTNETYINNIDIGTRLGVAQATLLKAMSGLTVNSNEAKLYEGWFKGGNFSDEKAVLAAVKSINNAMKRNIANVGYTYREDLPYTYLDSKTFTKVDIGKERANSTGSKKTITRTGKTPDGRRVIQYSDGTREYK